LLAGIDEAGYGPMLGPLCVGMTLLRVPDTQSGAPDVWQLLGRAVCREPGRGGRVDATGRIAVADSKRLKLANSTKSTHPLVHLERGVMSFLSALGDTPADSSSLFNALGADPPRDCWYAGSARLPVANDAGMLAIAGSRLRAELDRTGTLVEAVRCRVMSEDEFNTLARAGGKAATTLEALRGHLGWLWHHHAAPEQKIGVACDRLGGREAYAEVLARMLPGTRIETLEESPTRSRYIVSDADPKAPARRMGVSFLVEGERAHFTIALASMVAKYVRELSMGRFNEYWCGRALHEHDAQLRPTAGYALDARRWLADARRIFPDAEHRRLSVLVRIA
jgi:ribonuclease HII